ncbi:ribonuclease H-like protein [Peniophora sp. CONT]|nr:ribonuclease H-like protein [Peniophora sp. CONT]
MSEVRGRGASRARGFIRGRGRGPWRGGGPRRTERLADGGAQNVSTASGSNAATESSTKPPKPQRPPRPPFEGPLYDWSLATPKPTLHYLCTCEDADAAIVDIISRNPPAMGFDIEWRPQFLPKQPENPVALLQLASEEDIYLFQITSMREFPASLQDFLDSTDTSKVGVAINGDASKLFRDYRVDVRGCIDLSLLARTVDSRWTGKYNKPIGLAHLTETYLERGLQKGRISRSDWQAQLSEAQQNYAANDAHAGLMIWKALMQRAEAMTPVPDPDWYSFSLRGGVLRDDNDRPWFPFNPNYSGVDREEPKQLKAAAASATMMLD